MEKMIMVPVTSPSFPIVLKEPKSVTIAKPLRIDSLMTIVNPSTTLITDWSFVIPITLKPAVRVHLGVIAVPSLGAFLTKKIIPAPCGCRGMAMMEATSLFTCGAKKPKKEYE